MKRGEGIFESGADPVAALREGAKRCPGGVAALAAMVGMSPQVAYNKLGSDGRYILGDREADAMALHVYAQGGGQGYIQEKCRLHGGVFVPIPRGGAGDEDVLDMHLKVVAEFGKMASDYLEARTDGVITREEFLRLEHDVDGLVAAAEGFLACVKLAVREEPLAPSGPVKAVK